MDDTPELDPLLPTVRLATRFADRENSVSSLLEHSLSSKPEGSPISRERLKNKIAELLDSLDASRIIRK